MTTSATLLANSISWVTTIMVLSLPFRLRMTRSTPGKFRIQRPGNGHTLLLAAGELMGIGVLLVGQTDLLQKPQSIGPDDLVAADNADKGGVLYQSDHFVAHGRRDPLDDLQQHHLEEDNSSFPKSFFLLEALYFNSLKL